MSRDFKKEYEQHMNEQTPDLWARIEANLPVKEATVTENATLDAADVPNVVPMKQRKGMSRRRMTYGMTVAAALLICLLAVPVLRGAQGGKADSANFMAKDAAMPEMIVEDAAADTGAMGVGFIDNDMKYNADGAAPEIMLQEEECEVEELGTNDYAAIEDVNDSGQAEAAKVATFVAEVTILEMFEQDGKAFYRADIAGQEVIFILGEEFPDDVSLFIGEMYELSLEVADEEAIWDYVIVGM